MWSNPHVNSKSSESDNYSLDARLVFFFFVCFFFFYRCVFTADKI